METRQKKPLKIHKFLLLRRDTGSTMLRKEKHRANLQTMARNKVTCRQGLERELSVPSGAIPEPQRQCYSTKDQQC